MVTPASPSAGSGTRRPRLAPRRSTTVRTPRSSTRCSTSSGSTCASESLRKTRPWRIAPSARRVAAEVAEIDEPRRSEGRGVGHRPETIPPSGSSFRAVHVLVIGGTGPTGIPLVQGLVDRGHTVTILHRGTHERDETPAAVEHLHADPYDEDAARAMRSPAARSTSRTRCTGACACSPRCSRGHTGRVISVGGVPAYRGWMNAWLYDPPGLPVPVGEDAPTVDGAGGGREGLPHRPHRGSGVRSTTPTPRTSATRTCTARTSSPRASGSSCGASSTAGAASSSPTTASRCTTTATPRTSPTRCCSRSTSPTPPPGRSSTSPTRRCCRCARSSSSSPPRSTTEFEIVSMPYDLAVPGPAAARATAAHAPGARPHPGAHRPRVPRRRARPGGRRPRTARWLVDHPLARRHRGAHAHRSVRLRRPRTA